MSDFTRIPYANGAVFQTRFLYQELRRCGHEVTLIGPHDPESTKDELPPGTVEIPSLPLHTYPGVRIPLPLESWVYDANKWDFDICFAQTTTMLVEFGLWLRKMKGIPVLCVNTTHLAAAYEVLLPEKLAKVDLLHGAIDRFLRRPYERLFTRIYNESDGLVVLSEGLRDYWRERGVTVPIHVIPRAVQPAIFDKPLGPDPYAEIEAACGLSGRGARLLCAGRHTREKCQDRVIRIFAKHVLPKDPNATLTLVGLGPDTEYFKSVARELGVSHRVFFTGEVPFTRMLDYYAYSDVFVHGSLSETFGNVMGEALWCGSPTVAFADGMGVSAQIQDGRNGILIGPGKGERAEQAADASFGAAVLRLLDDAQLRATLGRAAARTARERAAPASVQQKMVDAFMNAREHVRESGLTPMVERSKLRQWSTTFRHFRSWSTYMGGIYLFGHLRPSKVDFRRANLHPKMGG